MTYNS